MLGVFTFLATVLIVGPFVARALGFCPAEACMPRPGAGGAGGTPQALPDWRAGSAARVGGAWPHAALAAPASARSGGSVRAAETIDVAGIEGRIEASSINRVRAVLEGHPERGLAVIRSWLHEQGR
jgi:hypothetical protein